MPLSLDAKRVRLPVRRPNPLDDSKAIYRIREYETRHLQTFADLLVVPGVTSVRDGVEHILKAPDSYSAARMLCSLNSRLNYDFKAFRRPHSRHTRLTFEFREAAGSMDPDWIAVWARICVGLVAFARDAPKKEFRTVVDRLARAEEKEQAEAEEGRRRGASCRYDVLDFLANVGLQEEAAFIQHRVLPDREAFWFPPATEHGINVFPGDAPAKVSVPSFINEAPR